MEESKAIPLQAKACGSILAYDNKNYRRKKYSNIYDHTKSELLQITTDKLKLKLKEYESGLKHRSIIISSIGQILAILLVFATSNFREFLGFSADTWQAVFIIILALLPF